MMKVNHLRSLAFAFLGAALFCSASTIAIAQGVPPGRVDAMGATDIDGVDVIIKKKPPDKKPLVPIGDHKGGKYNFGVLEQGTYSLSVQLVNSGANNKTYYESRSNTHASITIEGPEKGPIKQGWDLKTGKTVTLPGNTAMGKTQLPDEITFDADGKHAVKVTLTIVNDAPTKNPGPLNQTAQPATPKPGPSVQNMK